MVETTLALPKRPMAMMLPLLLAFSLLGTAPAAYAAEGDGTPPATEE